ncbi:MAG: hypothetical protein GY830_08755 [Bacteroidetes bacterium]|nr:hypothetical protein [Bacteroidota bacterium]
MLKLEKLIIMISVIFIASCSNISGISKMKKTIKCLNPKNLQLVKFEEPYTEASNTDKKKTKETNGIIDIDRYYLDISNAVKNMVLLI